MFSFVCLLALAVGRRVFFGGQAVKALLRVRAPDSALLEYEPTELDILPMRSRLDGEEYIDICGGQTRVQKAVAWLESRGWPRPNKRQQRSRFMAGRASGVSRPHTRLRKLYRLGFRSARNKTASPLNLARVSDNVGKISSSLPRRNDHQAPPTQAKVAEHGSGKAWQCTAMLLVDGLRPTANLLMGMVLLACWRLTFWRNKWAAGRGVDTISKRCGLVQAVPTGCGLDAKAIRAV